MAFGTLPSGMPAELGDALIAVDAIALAAFFSMLYSAEISALAGRLLKWLGLSQLLLRCRQWFSAHKASS